MVVLEPSLALLPLLIVLPVLAYRAYRRGTGGLRLMGQLALAVYLAVLVALTLFPLPLPAEWPPTEVRIDLNLRPFRTIGPALTFGPGSQQFRLLVGNLIAFMPLGLLVALVWPRRHSWALAATLGLALTVAVELGQLLLSVAIGAGYRSADIDDVLVNFVGALLGYAVFRVGAAIVRPIRRQG